ncbi:hypothetical protein, partial [Tenacibaculum maritimum]
LLTNIPLKTLPLTSKKLDTLYFYDDNLGYVLKKNIKKKKIDSIFFKLTKKRDNLNDNKGDYFYHFFYDDNRQFFPVYRINKEDYIIVGVLTFFYGENDIPGIQFELHSFNKKGEQLDYLLVYCRFTFEISYKNNFTIDKDFNIRINKEMIDYFDGDLDNERKTPLITKRVENYILNDRGLFEEVK